MNDPPTGRQCGESELQESSTVGGGTAYNNERPTFAARKGIMLREYHVLVTWSDGRREKVGRFLHRLDAACWIEQKSAEWLAHFHAAQSLNCNDPSSAGQSS